jgi:hypothetical protein
LKNRSENLAGRGQILTILQGNSHSIAQKSGEICTGQSNLQPISFKSDRLLGWRYLLLEAVTGCEVLFSGRTKIRPQPNKKAHE